MLMLKTPLPFFLLSELADMAVVSLLPPGSMKALLAHTASRLGDRITLKTDNDAICVFHMRFASDTLDYDTHYLLLVLYDTHLHLSLPGRDPRRLSYGQAADALRLWAAEHTAPNSDMRALAEALEAFCAQAARNLAA
jgi:hypothetical protein